MVGRGRGESAGMPSSGSAVKTFRNFKGLRERFRIPDEYEILLMTEDEPIHSEKDGCFVLSLDLLEVGFRLPVPQIAQDLLKQWGLAPIQLAPNAWRIILAVCITCGERRSGKCPAASVSAEHDLGADAVAPIIGTEQALRAMKCLIRSKRILECKLEVGNNRCAEQEVRLKLQEAGHKAREAKLASEIEALKAVLAIARAKEKALSDSLQCARAAGLEEYKAGAEHRADLERHGVLCFELGVVEGAGRDASDTREASESDP